MVEHASPIVKDVAIDLAQRYQGLKRVTERVSYENHDRDTEAQRSPRELFRFSQQGATR